MTKYSQEASVQAASRTKEEELSKTKVREIADGINAELGGSFVRMGSDSEFTVTYLSTGVWPIDELLGGGLPRGRMVECYGDYSTLKTYIGLRAIATTQAIGGTCVLVDTEHSFDNKWAEALGVDVSSLLLLQPESGEEAIDICEKATREHDVALVVWDSIAATQPQVMSTKRSAGEELFMENKGQVSDELREHIILDTTGKSIEKCVQEIAQKIGLLEMQV
jgi:recombination protein RecA